MNVEAYEQAMDAQFAVAETIWRTCLYDCETEDAKRGAEATESAAERTEP